MLDDVEREPDGIEPLVVRPRVAKRMLGDKENEGLWVLINTGELESYLDGRARLITVASIKGYVARQLAAAKNPPSAALSNSANERRRARPSPQVSQSQPAPAPARAANPDLVRATKRAKAECTAEAERRRASREQRDRSEPRPPSQSR